MQRRPVTIAEVARKAGVSPMTVSYSFSQPSRVAPATLEHVRAIAARMGFIGPDPSARSLRRGRVGSIGVILGEHLEYAFDDPQARLFLSGIAEACRERGAGLTLMPSTGGTDDLERLRNVPVDGYVLWTTYRSDPILEFVASTPKPVAVHGGPDVAGASRVGIADRAAAARVAAACYRSSRRPAVLSFPTGPDRRARVERGIDPDLVEFPVTAERLRGIFDFLESTGREPAETPVGVVARNGRVGSTDVITALLDAGADAIVAMSDELAYGVLGAAETRGVVVPDELTVSGWDDGPDAQRAGLTTVVQSLHEQGRDAALVALGEASTSSDWPWALAERASTARPSR